jgi:hypothetical protein
LGDRDFSSGYYELGSFVEPQGFAQVIQLCPSFEVGQFPQILACQQDSKTVYVNLNMFKLPKGTSLEEFVKSESSKLKGLRETVNSYETEMSDFPAYAIEEYGKRYDLPELQPYLARPKILNVYGVHDDIGYQFFYHAISYSEFDRYLPMFRQIIDSFEIMKKN